MAFTPYYPGGWQSGEEGGTPITPAALNHYDDAFNDVYDAIQQSTEDIKSVDTIGNYNGAQYDLNDLINRSDSGFYYVGANVENSPANYSGLITLVNNSGFSTQLLINPRNIYYRVRSGNPVTWGTWRNPNSYTINTTENFDSAAIGASGFVTSDAKVITFFIDLPKSLDLITSISCSRFNGTIRGTKGYVNSAGSAINWASTSGITIAAVKVSGNKLRINLTSTNAYTNVDNNTPLYFIGTVTLAMT